MKSSCDGKALNDWRCLISLHSELDKYCVEYSVNFVCGFFTSILSLKAHVPLQQWFSFLFDELNMPEIEQLNTLLNAMILVYNTIADQLYHDAFVPMFLESMNLVSWYDGREDSLLDWCLGYCQGLLFSSSDLSLEQLEYSVPITIFGGCINIEQEKWLTDEELSKLANIVPIFAQNAYNVAFDERADLVKVNATRKKLGRNKPCFCGSGKKYKKCCLWVKTERVH